MRGGVKIIWDGIYLVLNQVCVCVHMSICMFVCVKPQYRPKHSQLYFSLVAQMVKNLPAMWETQVWSCIEKIPWRRE